MTRFCRLVVAGFALLYLAALGLWVIGTFGLFGSPKGPLAGVFLVPLGLPWNLMLDRFSDGVRLWLAILSPLLDLVIVGAMCRLLSAAVRAVRGRGPS